MSKSENPNLRLYRIEFIKRICSIRSCGWSQPDIHTCNDKNNDSLFRRTLIDIILKMFDAPVSYTCQITFQTSSTTLFFFSFCEIGDFNRHAKVLQVVLFFYLSCPRICPYATEPVHDRVQSRNADISRERDIQDFRLKYCCWHYLRASPF